MLHYLINTEGELLNREPYFNIGDFSDGRSRVKCSEDADYGFIDESNAFVIPPIYESAKDFTEGLAAVRLPNTAKWGFVNTSGDTVVSFAYDDVNSFRNGRSAVYKDDQWNYIDITGRMISRTGFTDCEDFNEGYAVVKYMGKRGVINLDGELVVKNKYSQIASFSEGLAAFKAGAKFGFMNDKGEIVIEPIYHAVDSFSNGLAAVKLKNKWGFISAKGELVIPAVLDNPGIGFREGLCFVRINQNIGVIDTLGNTRVPFVFRYGLLGDCFEYYYHEGYAFAALNTEIGSINEDGYVIARKASNNSASNCTTGFIDANGKVAISFKYFYAWKFGDGLAPVFNKERQAGYVNGKGEETVPLVYDDAQPFKNGFAVVVRAI